MDTLIKWNTGDGSIVATYTGSGDGAISFASDTENEGLDRSQTVQVATTEGSCNVSVVVNQVGKREIFKTTDGFMLSGGGTFNVLKQ